MRNWWLCGFILCLLVTACSSSPTSESSVLAKSYHYGSLYMRQVNYTVNDSKVKKIEAKLQKAGVVIISVGQEYKIVFPAHILFYGHSPRIQWQSYALLNDVVDYLNCFNTIEVEVVGITQATGNSGYDHALGLAMAKSVADYLWGQEVGAGIMYTQSYTVVGQPSRMEINFRSTM